MIQATSTSTAEKLQQRRFRSACDPCRQSKVRCSGGTVCSRCDKHGFACRYSLADRAGKPKGSKNKATLKKLETLQERLQQKMYSSNHRIPTSDPGQTMAAPDPYWHSLPPPIPRSNMEHRKPQSSYTNISPTRLEGAECSSSSQGSSSSLGMNVQITDLETSSFSSDCNRTYYPSPISPGSQPHPFPPSLLAENLRTEPEAFVNFMTDHLPYLSESSPTESAQPIYSFSSSPMEEGEMFSAAFDRSFPEPPTPMDLLPSCDCLENQAASLNLLYHLSRGDNMSCSSSSSRHGSPRIDCVVEAVSKVLTSCRSLLRCSICPKECSNLLVAILTLDRLFAVFGQALVRELARQSSNYSPTSPISSLDDGGHSSMPSDLIHRTLAQSRETLAALKAVVDPASGPPPPPRPLHSEASHHYHHLSSPSSGLTPTPTPTSTTTTTTRTTMFSTSSYGWFTDGAHLADSDIIFLRQVILRCEIVLEGLRSLATTMTTSSTTYPDAELHYGEIIPPWTPTSPCWTTGLYQGSS